MSGDSTTARLNTSTPDWAARKASVQGSPWLDIKVSRCQERVKVTLSTPYNLAPERANIEITNHNAISHHSLAGAGVSMVKGKADVVAWSLNFTMEDQFSCIRDLVAATSISLLLSLRETHWLVSWIARSWFCSLSFKIHTQKALLPSVRTRRRSQVWLIINKNCKDKMRVDIPAFSPTYLWSPQQTDYSSNELKEAAEMNLLRLDTTPTLTTGKSTFRN